MQYGRATHRPNRQKFFHAQRSAMVPVGMVAVVSMNTIMKKNNAKTLTSSTPCRHQPLVPNKPHLWAPVGSPLSSLAASIPMPEFNTAVPGPSEEYQPGPTGP